MVGFLMPRLDGQRCELHELYTPATRKQRFRSADRAFLMQAARNVAAAAATVHAGGHVIGDVNQRNFIVGADATVKVLDCDSFQIRTANRVYLCEVGMPEFTPPELQGRPLSSVERTPNHDAFGLAVLSFQLLFMGRHPFAGRFLGNGEMPIERAIAERRFAFGRNSRAHLMESPQNMVAFDSLPPRLTALFESAFGDSPARPSSVDWTRALDAAQRELQACGDEPMHKFYRGLRKCSWCSLEAAAGVYFFIGVVTAKASVFDLAKTWAEIADATALSYEAPARPVFHLEGADLPPALSVRYHVAFVMKIVSTLLLTWVAVAVSSYAFVALAILLVVVFVPLPGAAELRARRSSFSDAERVWLEAYARAERDVSVEPLLKKRIELQSMRNTYERIEAEKREELAKMSRNAREIQLHRYLEQQLIRNHSISGIGPKRKATLSAWGINTAADVDPRSLAAVHGFGPNLRQGLLAWRASIEAGFVFDSKRAVPQQDLDACEYRWSRRKLDLERQLRAGSQDARKMKEAIRTRRMAIARELEPVARSWAQAYVDLEAIRRARSFRRS